MLDMIHDIESAMESSESEVMQEMANVYVKSLMIMEATDDITPFDVFQEAVDVNETINNMKARSAKAPKESLVVKIIKFIPRMIQTLVNICGTIIKALLTGTKDIDKLVDLKLPFDSKYLKMFIDDIDKLSKAISGEDDSDMKSKADYANDEKGYTEKINKISSSLDQFASNWSEKGDKFKHLIDNGPKSLDKVVGEDVGLKISYIVSTLKKARIRFQKVFKEFSNLQSHMDEFSKEFQGESSSKIANIIRHLSSALNTITTISSRIVNTISSVEEVAPESAKKLGSVAERIGTEINSSIKNTLDSAATNTV